MGSAARSRLGTTSSFSATGSSTIFHPTYNATEAEDNGEYIEIFNDNGTNNGLAAVAIHGGGIEPWTDEEAERLVTSLSSSNVSSYLCKGWKVGGGSSERWHITSVEVSPRSFPGIGTMQQRQFQYVVSFHGFSGSKEVVVGGGASLALRNLVQASIASRMPGTYNVRVAADGEPIDGNDPSNFINYITLSGSGAIQLEQTLDSRSNYWQNIADGVASVFNTLL